MWDPHDKASESQGFMVNTAIIQMVGIVACLASGPDQESIRATCKHIHNKVDEAMHRIVGNRPMTTHQITMSDLRLLAVEALREMLAELERT